MLSSGLVRFPLRLLNLALNNMSYNAEYKTSEFSKLNVCSEASEFSPHIMNIESQIMWHGRLGHVSVKKIKRMMDLDLISRSLVDYKHKCEVCVSAKQTRKPHKEVVRSTQLLELIHSDVCDSIRPPTRVGNKYFVTCIDDYSRYCFVYPIKTKDEVFSKFQIYKKGKIERCWIW